MVEVPAPEMDVGLKLTVTPPGWPVADKAIAELKPPETEVVIVDVAPLPPRTTVTEAGEAEIREIGSCRRSHCQRNRGPCALRFHRCQ